MVDYTKSKIYKITCNITGLTYYGSTVNPISKRISNHRCEFKSGRGRCSSRQVLVGGNYDYSLVEEFSCENKDQLHRRERYYIENNDCVNKEIPGRTLKEYREQNKDKLLAQGKEYREQNKDKISEYYEQNKDKLLAQGKEYREQNKNKISEYYEQNKDKLLAQGKEYREQNKNKISEYSKEYYEQNKDKLLAQRSTKVTCECGSVFTVGSLSRHKRTKKHQAYLESRK
jgi:hypothetical protein